MRKSNEVRVTLLLTTCLVSIFVMPTVRATYELVWTDEFEGNSLDLTKWRFDVDCWGGGNQEQQCYTNNPSNLIVENGALTIKQNYYPSYYPGVDKAHGCTSPYPDGCLNPKPFTSAKISTRLTQSWIYGRFEFRVQFPAGRFLWPALWLLPTDNVYGTWAASGEIDIAELKSQYSDKVFNTIHFGGVDPYQDSLGTGPQVYAADFTQSYHVFAFEWTDENMTWYVDNEQVFYQDLARSWWSGKGNDPYKGAFYKPWDQSFHIVMNVAVAGGFFGADDGVFVPSSDYLTWTSPMKVDFVRVYREKDPLSPTPTPTTTPTPTPSTTATPTPIPIPTPSPSIPSENEQSWHEPVIVILIGVVAFLLLVIIGLSWSLRQASQVMDTPPPKLDEMERLIDY